MVLGRKGWARFITRVQKIYTKDQGFPKKRVIFLGKSSSPGHSPLSVGTGHP
jgi:hypothetical protein